MMPGMDVASHLRKTFIAGLFAAIPIVVTAVAVYWIDKQTRPIAQPIVGDKIPFVGLIVALVLVYGLGLIVSTALAKYLLNRLDRSLERLPVLKPLYTAWKQVSLNSASGGMWDKVVLIEVETGQTSCIGFTSGVPMEGDCATLCVYVPSAPVPTTGRLYFVPLHRCRLLDCPPEDAFKHLLSGGNFVPPGVTQAVKSLASTATASTTPAANLPALGV